TATNANAPNNDLGWGIAKFYNMHSGQSSFQIEQEMTVEPNPAVNSVIFNFDPPLSAHAKLRIFSVAGDKIVTLALDIPESGSMDRYEWSAAYNNSGDKIAAGIYIAHLQSVSESLTMKFAFVK
ncbi:MAG: T9SS type A sorting domain-containing protein, partial [candidate division Zixibacteria bacterium]|nr:T9SS type A sorting domain-containing protein [candidate division Zixibacteria bacterium]